MKQLLAMCLALICVACGPSLKNDPYYQALKANPPTVIPKEYLPRLRQGRAVCDVFNEGKASQYMTCWWPQDGLKPVQTAYLAYYPPNPRSPPEPSRIVSRGGQPVNQRIPVK